MKNVLAFGASSSQQSINKKLAIYTAHQILDVNVTSLDLNDFEMPIFSVDKEQNSGIPDLAHKFNNFVKEADGIIVSFAEHNGSYTTAFKNILDWFSRIEGDKFGDKPTFIMGTSPGGRGASTILGSVKTYWPFLKANIVAEFSLPKYFENFDLEKGVVNKELDAKLQAQLVAFSQALK